MERELKKRIDIITNLIFQTVHFIQNQLRPINVGVTTNFVHFLVLNLACRGFTRVTRVNRW